MTGRPDSLQPYHRNRALRTFPLGAPHTTSPTACTLPDAGGSRHPPSTGARGRICSRRIHALGFHRTTAGTRHGHRRLALRTQGNSRFVWTNQSSVISIHVGAWSLVFSQPRTSRSTPALLSRGASLGLNSKWSMRIPASRLKEFWK